MIGAHLVLVVLLSQSPPDPAALVARLGASRYAEREAAAATLERLGRPALPALRSAHTAKDPEIRARAAALVQKIEGALLTQPTLIKLDFENRPLPEVVRELSERTGLKITLFPENLPVWPTLRVTLSDPAPVPFWQAMDRLCDAARVYYNPAVQAMPGTREPVFQLFYGGARPTGPVSDQGPFRVMLQGVHYQRDVTFLQGGARPLPNAVVMMPVPPLPAPLRRRPGQPLPKAELRPARPANNLPNPPDHHVTTQFYAQLQVCAEPRLAITLNGAPKVVEAVDDLGQSLNPAQNPGGTTVQRVSGYFGLTAGSTVPLQVPLNHPEQRGKKVQKLKGSVPVAVTTRKPNPLAIALAGSAGKSFQNDDVSITVQDIKVNPATHQTSIEFTVRSSEPRDNHLAVAGAPGAEFVYQRPDMHQQQIEVVDAQGRGIPWYQSSYDAEGARITLTLTPPDPTVTATHLRYYSLARTTTELGFEFSDIPLE